MPPIQGLDRVLARVQKPARYTGGEWNSIVRPPWRTARARFVLAYPDLYDIGMSNLGLGILYDILNHTDGALAERVYAPWIDLEAEMRAGGIPLFSLESRRPLGEFDVIGFSLSYEGTYTNVLNMLDLAGLPVRAAERDERHPLVIAGGSGALNPDTLADFVDAFALGDGEETVADLARALIDWKAQGGGPKKDLLRRLAAIPGVYVPSFYDVAYNSDGTVAAVTPNDPAAPPRVHKRFVQTLPPAPVNPIVPFLQTVHDRAAIEIQRGCTQGCRFCQAGMIYRPRLERSPEEVVATAKELLRNTGYDELSLVSLSTTDHSRIVEVVDRLREEFGDGLSISLPSMRVDSFSVRIAEAVSSRGKSGITFAPEAGTERLRFHINKQVKDADLYQAVESAFAQGWTSVKMYFMVGLPTETMEDIDGIAGLAKNVRDIGRRHHGGRARVRVSTSNFIPKAHTPFQWGVQMRPDDLRQRHERLRAALKKIGVAFSWEEPEHSLLEAILSRADRRFGRVIERAWRAGAKFDAWSEFYGWPRWEQAMAAEGLDPSFYAHRERGLWEKFPWSHIDVGVTEAYLRGEWLKTLRGEITPDCHKAPCNVCGVQNQGAEDCLPRFAERIRVNRERQAERSTDPVQVIL